MTTAADTTGQTRSTLVLGLAGALLVYLAQPPAALGLLAWIAPVPWILLVRRDVLAGRRPYRTLWLCGFLHWLVMVQWIRLAHTANYGAWLFVAAYLGCYLPAFVALARLMVHCYRVPLWLAAPIAWTGLEWLRARLLTGFLMASLAHTQVAFPTVLQIADLAGEYAVTFLIMLVAGSIAAALPVKWIDRISVPGSAWGSNGAPSAPSTMAPTYPQAEPGAEAWRRTLLALVPGAAALVVALLYGNWFIGIEPVRVATERPSDVRIALVQSDMLADWKGTAERDETVMRQQMELSIAAADEAREAGKPLDLVVWPETMFRTLLFVRDEENPPPDDAVNAANYDVAKTDLAAIARQTKAAVLVGLDRIVASGREPSRSDPGGESSPPYQLIGHNAAVCVNRDGALVGSYDKMHLMPFGEYVPLVEWIPFLSSITPITGGAIAGDRGAAFEVEGVFYSPSICYEKAIPQLIRRQFLDAFDRTLNCPDVLANVTNDAWYWGSAELDMHLACGVLRAVEMRRPMVIAGNRGLSAHIDRAGRIVQVTERDRPGYLLCDVEIRRGVDALPTFYARWGDWLPLACLICCTVFAVHAGVRHRMKRTSDGAQ